MKWRLPNLWQLLLVFLSPTAAVYQRAALRGTATENDDGSISVLQLQEMRRSPEQQSFPDQTLYGNVSRPSKEAAQAARKVFEKLDKNMDKQLDKQELHASLEGLADGKAPKLTLDTSFNFEAQRDPGDSEAMAVEKTFDMMDKDFDDSLSNHEFLLGFRRAQKSRNSNDVDFASPEELFKAVDVDENGAISRAEFVKAAHGSDDLLALSKPFEFADADNDGFVSQDEFLYRARQFYPADWADGDNLRVYFRLLDTDLDGRLSRAEFRKQADGGPNLRPRSWTTTTSQDPFIALRAEAARAGKASLDAAVAVGKSPEASAEAAAKSAGRSAFEGALGAGIRTQQAADSAALAAGKAAFAAALGPRPAPEEPDEIYELAYPGLTSMEAKAFEAELRVRLLQAGLKVQQLDGLQVDLHEGVARLRAPQSVIAQIKTIYLFQLEVMSREPELRTAATSYLLTGSSDVAGNTSNSMVTKSSNSSDTGVPSAAAISAAAPSAAPAAATSAAAPSAVATALEELKNLGELRELRELRNLRELRILRKENPSVAAAAAAPVAASVASPAAAPLEDTVAAPAPQHQTTSALSKHATEYTGLVAEYPVARLAPNGLQSSSESPTGHILAAPEESDTFTLLDTNGDGKLTPDELQRWQNVSLMQRTTEDEDKDNRKGRQDRGAMESTEGREWEDEVQSWVGKSAMEDREDMEDKENREGREDREHREAMESTKGMEGREDREDIFTQLDENGDGRIQFEELQKWKKFSQLLKAPGHQQPSKLNSQIV